MTSPEPIVRNDFVEEAEAFIHSVGGYVLVQHLVVSGDNDNDDDCDNDEDMDVNDDDGNCNILFEKICNSLACSRQEKDHQNVREAVDPGLTLVFVMNG